MEKLNKHILNDFLPKYVCESFRNEPFQNVKRLDIYYYKIIKCCEENLITDM